MRLSNSRLQTPAVEMAQSGGIRGWLFWLCFSSALDRRALDQVVVASLLLEKLREMVFTVEDALQGCIVGRCNRTAPVGAFEAWLMVGLFFNCYLCNIFNSHALEPLSTCFAGSRKAIRKSFDDQCKGNQERIIRQIKMNKDKILLLNGAKFRLTARPG